MLPLKEKRERAGVSIKQIAAALEITEDEAALIEAQNHWSGRMIWNAAIDACRPHNSRVRNIHSRDDDDVCRRFERNEREYRRGF